MEVDLGFNETSHSWDDSGTNMFCSSCASRAHHPVITQEIRLSSQRMTVMSLCCMISLMHDRLPKISSKAPSCRRLLDDLVSHQIRTKEVDEEKARVQT